MFSNHPYHYISIFESPVENHCRPTNPCEHDGLCVETEDGYKCRCKVGYKGVNCEGKSQHLI